MCLTIEFQWIFFQFFVGSGLILWAPITPILNYHGLYSTCSALWSRFGIAQVLKVKVIGMFVHLLLAVISSFRIYFKVRLSEAQQSVF